MIRPKNEKLMKNPRGILSLTGYTLDEYCSLLPYFLKCLMEQKYPNLREVYYVK